MSNIRKYTSLIGTSFILSLSVTLAACGGGGGGGSTSPTGITYTGITSPAEVDNTNTQAFSASILDGSQDSETNLNQIVTAAISTAPRQNKQPAMINRLVENIKVTVKDKLSTENALAAGLIPSDIGNCPGKEGSTRFTDNSTSSNVDLSINYNRYCITTSGIEETINGSITVTGTFFTATTNLKSLSISITRLTFTVVDTNTNTTLTNEISGSISANFNSDGSPNGINISVNFIENGKVFKIENMTYTEVATAITISGTLFHPDFGSVTFTTTQPFTLFNDQLCGGTLEVTGANSNFSITADTTCASYTYAGTDKNGVAFSGNLTIL